MNQQSIPNRSTPVQSEEDWLAVVKQKVSTLRFGVVQVVVHEGRVVQIECTEKMRFDRPKPDHE